MGVPAECDPNGNGFSEFATGQVPYGSTIMSQIIQAIRLQRTDSRGNYAIGCLEDGTMVIGRSSGAMHAEEDVIRQAGFRRIVDLYSERQPCQEDSEALTGGFNKSWSFLWNPPTVREASTAAFRAAMNELFQRP